MANSTFHECVPRVLVETPTGNGTKIVALSGFRKCLVFKGQTRRDSLGVSHVIPSLLSTSSLFFGAIGEEVSHAILLSTIPTAQKSRDTWRKKQARQFSLPGLIFVEPDLIPDQYGGGGDRTPVPRYFHGGIYMCSYCFTIFISLTGQQPPAKQTIQELCLTVSVLDVTHGDLELVTSFLGSPAKPISRWSLLLSSQCERVIFCN